MRYAKARGCFRKKEVAYDVRRTGRGWWRSYVYGTDGKQAFMSIRTFKTQTDAEMDLLGDLGMRRVR